MSVDQTKLGAFLDKVVTDLAAGYGGVMVSLGDRLGLYKAMAGAGPLTVDEVARRSDCHERYVREWLNSQVAGGYIEYDPDSSTYALSPEQAAVLADDTSPVFMPPAWQVPASMWFDEDKAVAAFRTGCGVSWGDHDARLSCGSAAFYRNAYLGSLVDDWLPSLDGVVEKLRSGARVADVGCGHGHSAVIMADAFPKSEFWGYDLHRESIAVARENAARAGVDERVHFDIAGADGYPDRDYDLICFIDCLHDLGDPVAAARHAAGAISPTGSVMLVEPYAGDRVEEHINAVGRLYYATSTTICCAHAIHDGGALVLGAQAGESRLSHVFRQAGFSRFRKAKQTPFNFVFEATI